MGEDASDAIRLRREMTHYGDQRSIRGTSSHRLLMSFETARAGAGLGEVPGRALFLAAARLGHERGSFLACALAGCRGEAWLKKGLPSSK